VNNINSKGGTINNNLNMEDGAMAKQTDKKTETKEINWLEGYCKEAKVKKSCASHVTNEMVKGATMPQLIELAKKFNAKQGKNAKCLTTEGSLKSHFRWLRGKGCSVVCKNDQYKVSFSSTDRKVA